MQWLIPRQNCKEKKAWQDENYLSHCKTPATIESMVVFESHPLIEDDQPACMTVPCLTVLY